MTEEEDRPSYHSGIARSIWLHICREGGKWSPDEIAEKFSLPRQKAAVTMHNMATQHRSLRRYTEARRARFGVTAACMIPKGISLAELAGVGVVSEVAA